jgi:predicted permease
MIVFLRIWFFGVVLVMLAVTVWASLRGAIWEIPAGVWQHPWFIATLFDAYFAFIAFSCWVAYKETSALPRILWIVAILLLGNFAIAAYCLIQLFKVRRDASLGDVLVRR